MMQLLLDTHAFLWWLSGSRKLDDNAQRAIAEPQNQIFVSAISGLEIGIKRSLGKLQAPVPLDDQVLLEGFRHLPVTFQHGEQVGELPWHHCDPFDRILVAQAQIDSLILVTRDQHIPMYDVPILGA